MWNGCVGAERELLNFPHAIVIFGTFSEASEFADTVVWHVEWMRGSRTRM